MVSGNQEHKALTGGDRLLKAAVDGPPRRIEVHPVQVEHSIRLDIARSKPPIPGPV